MTIYFQSSTLTPTFLLRVLFMMQLGDDGVEQASSASSRELAAAATHHEDVGDPPSLTGPSTRDQPSNHQQRPPLLINLVGGHMTGSHSDSFDLASSDRDTDRENGCLTEGSTASSSVRRRALQAVPSSGTKNERTGSRYIYVIDNLLFIIDKQIFQLQIWSSRETAFGAHQITGSLR